MISEHVKSFIEKYSLKEPFIVAFSGGYDSMCLLDVLCKLKFNVIAVHLNHNWRGEESFKEEINCKNFAQSKNIKFYSETLDNSVAHTETAARDARYDFFKRCAEKFSSNVVFTAHNFDDNAETVLYRIVKGTGISGLAGISENRDIFYRPLLKVKRKDIESYCKNNNLTPNKDSSNSDLKYKRNLIRNKILPLLNEINPEVKKSLNSLAELAAQDCKLLENCNDLTYSVRKLLIKNNIDYDRKKIEEIKNFIEENKNSKSGKKMSLTSDKFIYTNSAGFEVITLPQKSNEEIEITKIGEYKIDNSVFSIKECNEIPKIFPQDSENKAYINIKDVDFTLRHRKDGDVIQPLGSIGKQKLKKYLNEKKIPNHIKDTLTLLCKDKEVLWVAGYGISDKIKVKNKPTHIIELRGEYE